jgi:hypothetical protein
MRHVGRLAAVAHQTPYFGLDVLLALAEIGLHAVGWEVDDWFGRFGVEN